MRIELTTVYKSVDEDFIEYYIKNLEKAGLPLDFEIMRNGEVVSFSSKNKDGMVATTKYQVIRDEETPNGTT